MTCEEFARLLDEERPLADLEALAHVASCPQCARAVERWQAARQELRSMASDAPPPFLHARIMAGVRAESAADRRPRRVLSLGRVVLATAAVALVASLAGYEVLRQRTPTAERQVLSEEPSRPEAPAPAPVAGGAEMGKAHTPAQPPAVAKEEAGAREGAVPERRTAHAPAPVRAASTPRVKGVTAAGPGGAPAPLPPTPQTTAEKAQTYRDEVTVAGGLPAVQPLNAAARSAANEAAPPPQTTGRAMAMADAAKRAEAPPPAQETVSCVLHSEATGGRITIGLPAHSAPPAGETWAITVGGDSGVRIADGRGSDITAANRDLRDWLRALALAPGRYTLTRRTE